MNKETKKPILRLHFSKKKKKNFVVKLVFIRRQNQRLRGPGQNILKEDELKQLQKNFFRILFHMVNMDSVRG